MAGRRSVYDKHLKAGHDYAWESRWDKAVEQYRLALAEFPDEPSALAAIAQAYRELGRISDASEAYREFARVAPADPMPLMQRAQLEAELGHTDTAVETYMALAEVYQAAGDIRQTISAWERVIRLAPDHIVARQRLAASYLQTKALDKAVEQHLALAGILQRMGQVEKAIQQCRDALRLAPDSLAARNMLEMLREGADLDAQPLHNEAAHLAGQAMTPADETQRKALTELAGVLFEEKVEPASSAADAGVSAGGERASVEALLSAAIDYQTRGLVDEAISSYLRLLKMGESRSAIHFNLGLLFQRQMRFEEAIEHLLQSVKVPEYRLGSHYALGECYRAQGEVGTSMQHFLEVIKIVDLETVGREQADDLIQLYENLAESHRVTGDPEKAKTFSDSLVQFLSSKGWQDKVREARNRLDAAGDGVTVSMAELLQADGSDQVLRALSLSQEYAKRRLLTAAGDECYRALEYAPWYLPAHLRLADVWFQMGDAARAADKYRLVADVYRMRGDSKRAVTVYRRLLKVNPADTGARQVCIELLKEQGDYEGAVEESLAQVEAMARVAQVDAALELADQTQRLVQERSLGPRWQAAVLHQVGEMQISRVEWRAALDSYRQIIALSPSDERAHVRLVDLHYKLSQGKEALGQLNELLALYKQRGENQRAISVLSELVELRQQEVELHRLLADAYQSAGRLPEAIQEWDLASRILWNAGESEEARRVVRYLMVLDPEGADSYRARLRQMGG